MTAPVIRCWKNTDSGGSTTTSLTIDAPSSSSYDGGTNPKNIAAGDLLIILCGNDDSTNTLQWDNTTNKPSGFNLLYTWGNSTIQAHFAVFYKVAGSSESSTIAVPSVSSNEMWASYLCITGWSGDTADLIVDTHNGDGTPPLSIPAITVTDTDTLVIALAAYDGADSGGFTWTSPYTEQAELYSGSNPTAASGTWASRVMTSTGSTGVAEVTYVTTSDGMIGIQFGIPPSTSSTGSLTVTESGSDTAAISGDVLVDGTLSVTEAASDSPAFTGSVGWPGFTYVYNSSSELLSAPQLLTARKKPVGPVKIDWNHPSARGLASFGLVTSSLYAVDLVSGVQVGYYSNKASLTASGMGTGLRFNSPSRNAEALLLSHLKGFYDGLYNVSQMVICAFNGSSTSTDEDSLIGQWSNMQGQLYDADARFYLRFDSDTGKQYFEAGLVSNNTSVYETSFTTGVSAASFDDGNIHQVIHTAGTFSGGDIQRVYFDGQSVGQQSVVMPIEDAASAYHVPEVMGAHNVTGTASQDAPRYDLYCWALWRRRIEADEAADLWADPYQILVPA